MGYPAPWDPSSDLSSLLYAERVWIHTLPPSGAAGAGGTKFRPMVDAAGPYDIYRRHWVHHQLQAGLVRRVCLGGEP